MPVLGFVIYNEAWYANPGHPGAERGCKHEILIGNYEINGNGVSGEFVVRWYDLDGRLSPRLEMFGDSWQFLASPTWKSLFERMATRGGLHVQDPEKYPAHTPEEFKELLLELGFADITPKTNPYYPRG